jgi:hypothetical protein
MSENLEEMGQTFKIIHKGALFGTTGGCSACVQQTGPHLLLGIEHNLELALLAHFGAVRHRSIMPPGFD